MLGGFRPKTNGSINTRSGGRTNEKEEVLALVVPAGLGGDIAEFDGFDEEGSQALPCEAARSVNPRRHFGDPTRGEIEHHNLTHRPCRRLCPVRVEAQGEEDPHYRSTTEDIIKESLEVSMDCNERSEHDDEKRNDSVQTHVH